MRVGPAARVRRGEEKRPRRRKHGRRRPAARPARVAKPKGRARSRLRLPKWKAPKLPRLRTGGAAARWRLLVLVGFLPLAAGAVWLGGEIAERIVAHPAMSVREVRVDGVTRADAAELRALADVAQGDPWLALDSDRIRFRLESHPWVQRARILRPWPGQVRLRITECVPVARIRVANVSYGLCDDLRVVPLPEEAGTLPEVRDFGSGLGADEESLSRGLIYLSALRRNGLEEAVRLDLRREGSDWIVLPDRGFEAEVDGRIPASRAARNVSAFLERLDAQGGSRGTLRLIANETAVWRAAA